MNNASSYDEAVPALREFLARFERAVARTRSHHLGDSYVTVRSALIQAMADEDVKPMVQAVVDDLARQISEDLDAVVAGPEAPESAGLSV